MSIPTTLLHHEHGVRPVDPHAFHRRALTARPLSGRGWHHRHLTACIMALALALVLSSAATALAGTATVTITDSAGQADPAAGIPRVVKVTGNADTNERVYVRYRATGGAPCAPSYDADSGTHVFSNEDVSGTFELRSTETFSAAGTYRFCIWIAEGPWVITSPIAQEVKLRAPTGSIGATIDPAAPRPRQSFTVTIAGASEVPLNAYASIHPAGTQCAPTFGSDNGEGLLSGDGVNGAFSTLKIASRPTAGAYVVCLWLATSPWDTAPIATTMLPLSIAAPPRPPCVVPRLPANGQPTLNAVSSRLRKAHCRPGKKVRKRSSTVRKGRVIRLGTRPGTTLANNAAVSVVVSRGRR